MSKLLLYVTSDCSLCDEALDVLFSLRLPGTATLSVIDIVDEDHLIDRFGDQIPVLVVGEAQFGGTWEPSVLRQWLEQHV